MIKKIAFLFVVALAVSGCNDVNYDSETRLVVQGQLTDYNGIPLASKNVEVAVFDEFDYEYPNGEIYPKDVISRGITDGEGRFKLVFPAPKGFEDNIGVRINRFGIAYQQKQFLKIHTGDFSGFRFDLGQVQLYQSGQVSQFHIEPDTNNANRELLDVSVDGFLADELVYVNPVNGNLLMLDYSVRTNQTITIHYKVADHSTPNTVITENTVDVVIGADQVTYYTLNY